MPTYDLLWSSVCVGVCWLLSVDTKHPNTEHGVSETSTPGQETGEWRQALPGALSRTVTLGQSWYSDDLDDVMGSNTVITCYK